MAQLELIGSVRSLCGCALVGGLVSAPFDDTVPRVKSLNGGNGIPTYLGGPYASSA